MADPPPKQLLSFAARSNSMGLCHLCQFRLLRGVLQEATQGAHPVWAPSIRANVSGSEDVPKSAELEEAGVVGRAHW